jgi:anti-sigma regulatory factor (Ser/Thr protein kinase)
MALFYRDRAERRARVLEFARVGLARGEPLFIALPGNEARTLQDELVAKAGDLECSDMSGIGLNPARIIPELQAFVDRHPGQRVRFVGEPIWLGRSPAEICEATRHEALINLAFSRTPITILCPYDRAQLAPSVIGGARHTHRELLADGQSTATAGHGAPWQVPPECDRALPPPPPGAELTGYATDLAPVRRLVARHARRTRLSPDRAADLVLSASEIAANTLRHTGSDGVFHVWHDDDEIVCQVHDQGWIADPLAGRVRRSPESRGHGLFLVNQVCDLVELRTGRAGTTIRLHMRLSG